MKKLLLTIFITAGLVAGFSVFAEDSTQTLLNPWTVLSGYIKARSATNGLQVPSLASPGDCVTTDSSGKFLTASCGTGGGGSSSTPAGLTNSFQYKVNATTFGGSQLFQNGNKLGQNSSTPGSNLVVQGSSTSPTIPVLTVASSSGTSYLQVTGAGVTFIRNADSVRIASTYAGADCGAKINAASADLGALPGEIWVSQYCGTTISTAVVIPSNQILRFTQAGTYTTSATITGGHIIGPTPVGGGIAATMTVIKQANSANLPYVVRINTIGGNVERMEIDGNKANNTATTTGISIYRAVGASLKDNHVHDTDGIGVYVEATNEVTIDASVQVWQNNWVTSTGMDCARLENSLDAFVSMNLFYNCTGKGLTLYNSAGARIWDNDFGTITGIGLYATGTPTGSKSGFLIVKGNQFGNNLNHSLYIDGNSSTSPVSWSNTIVGNQFISGSAIATSTYNAITLRNTFGNTVSGNTITSTVTNGFKYSIQVLDTGNESGVDSITGNTNVGTFSTAACGFKANTTISSSNSGTGCTNYQTGATTFKTSAFDIDGGSANTTQTIYYDKVLFPSVYLQMGQYGALGSIITAVGAGAGFDTISLNNEGGTRLYVGTTGNVGIGTTTPGQTLVVNGSTTITSLGAGCVNATATGGLYAAACGGGSLSGGTPGKVAVWSSASALTTGSLLDNGTVAGVNATSSTSSFNIQQTGALNPFTISSSTGVNYLTVLANGNVGIGTTTATANLEVQGNIHQNGGFGVPTVICSSGSTSSAITSSAETNLANCRIPAGILGTNGMFKLEFIYKFAGGNNTRTITLRHTTASGSTSGGTVLLAPGALAATVIQFRDIREVWNTNSASAQIEFGAANTGFGANTGSPTTGTINTAADSWINFNCAMTNNSTDTCQLMSYVATVYPAN